MRQGHDLDILETSRHAKIMNLTEQLLINKGYFEELREHVAHNYQIADFYQNEYERGGDELYDRKSRAVDNCAKWWDLEHYTEQHVKDIKRVNLCRDKFCFNCQSMLAAKRYGKFAPVLDSLKSSYRILHIVFTVPNCEPEELKPLIDKMYRKFPFLMRYFKGQAKVHGVNFLKYGYGGAVRGLEVTYNKDTEQYHPHFHCMVLLNKKINLQGKRTNAYSFDHNDESKIHKFSDFEILLQKIWFLLMNDCKVTAENVEQLKIGYDVQASDPKGNYHEVFKYACKGAFKESEGACIYQERVFWTLYGALKNRRMIQGYGVLHNFNDLDGEILETDAAAIYAAYIAQLKRNETPIFKVESLDEVCERSATSCKYISKSNIKRILAEVKRQEQGGKP